MKSNGDLAGYPTTLNTVSSAWLAAGSHFLQAEAAFYEYGVPASGSTSGCSNPSATGEVT